jgi:small subunit ribosomal protein S20
MFWRSILANSKQAKKRARQSEDRRQQNASQRSTMRTHLKRATKVIAEGKVEQAAIEYRVVTSAVDRMAAKGLIHKNKAARHKSRLAAKLKALA